MKAMLGADETMMDAAEGEEQEPMEHEICEAAETVLEAEGIKKDEKLWPLVQKKLLEKQDSIKKLVKPKSIADLKKISYEKSKA